MQKLYYEDQYLKKFTAEIDEVKEVGNEFHIVLNKTAFFPGGNVSKLSFKKLQNDIFSKKSPCFHRLFLNNSLVIYIYFLF